ncbi:radical SAM/SPASM domain-containing protein [Streptomyces sp. NPDC015171]|uniref:radical SAM/SPASM domain-containing protein n=1 Tax=Streptomyces sp. NPDC015171 TaxID=3364945 RepID=UPI0036F836AB
MTVIAETPVIQSARNTGFVWLDLTRKCQLECGHCHNGSGPDGTHGTMTAEDWTRVLNEAAAAGIPGVQFTGGEVTMHPDAPHLIKHALTLGLAVEVYSNLVHVDEDWWKLFRGEGVTLATSYYGPKDAHNEVTRRPSHAHTRANILKAVKAAIPIRVSVIVSDPADTGQAACDELKALGVKTVRVDHVRPFGRAADGQKPCTDGLCGQCGDGRASVAPDGKVSPCVFSTWLGVGNVKDAPLGAILGGPEMAQANAVIRQSVSLRPSFGCGPDSPCGPDNQPEPQPDNGECSPGFPGSSCSPRN